MKNTERAAMAVSYGIVNNLEPDQIVKLLADDGLIAPDAPKEEQTSHQQHALNLLRKASRPPWEVTHDNHGNPSNVLTSDGHVIASYDGGMGGDPEWANPTGDLPLIAAAPYLANIVATTFNEYAAQWEDQNGTELGRWNFRPDNAIREVRDIQKANGTAWLVSRAVGPITRIEVEAP